MAASLCGYVFLTGNEIFSGSHQTVQVYRGAGEANRAITRDYY